MKVFVYLKELIIITMGCFIAAFGISCFLTPNNLSSGGFSGVALIFYYLFKIPIGTMNILLNIPIFILGYIRTGKNLIFKSLYCTVIYSKFIDFFNQIAISNNRLIASIYGGLLIGIGLSLILKEGCTTGGTDLIAYLIQDYKLNIKMSKIMVLLDFFIIVMNIVVFGDYEVGIYSLIVIYIVGKMVNWIFES